MASSQREYGFFTIQHFDFPLNDSLTKVFRSQTLVVTMTVIVDYRDTTGGTNGQLQNVEKTFDIDIPLSLKRTHSPSDFAATIHHRLSTVAHSLVNEQNPSLGRVPESHWVPLYQGFEFDGSNQKFNILWGIGETYDDWLENGGQRYVPQRIRVLFGGPQLGRQGQLAAAIFGGEVLPDNLGWSADFDTGPTIWFIQRAKGFKAEGVYQVAGMRPVRMFVDPYVYIRGSPEQSVWNADGTTTDIMTMQPRNRPPGVITNTQAYLGGQSHKVKTSLASLRSMTLRFTDSEGHILELDEDYVIKITVDFQQ